MSKFMTEKEIEALLESETRYLPIPEPVSTTGNQIVTIYKKKPVTMLKYSWETYDFLVDEEYKFYTRNELIGFAVVANRENNLGFSSNFHSVVATAHAHLRENLLPLLNSE
jgi:hypothetical protein